jgi:hypothetical protein
VEDPVKLTKTEARGGTKLGVMRYVLIISVVLVVIAFALIFRAYSPA